jgi:hypothetical protein
MVSHLSHLRHLRHVIDSAGGSERAQAQAGALVAGVQYDDANTVTVQFDRDVAPAAGPFAGQMFTVNGLAAYTVSVNAGDLVQLVFAGTVAPGDVWRVTGQPGWCGDLVAFPQSGVIPEPP